MVVMAIVGPGLLGLIIVMGVSGGIGGSRFSRSVVINIKENSYLEASVAIGGSTSRVLFFGTSCPTSLAPIIISFSLAVPGVILGEASLSFLGLRHTAAGAKLGRDVERQRAPVHVQRAVDGDLGRVWR